MKELSHERIKELVCLSYSLRKDILEMMRNGEGHIGGAFSILDILTVLYEEVLSHDPQRPQWPDRDRLILSAGHKCLALYVVLAQQGYFEPAILSTYNTFNTRVPMHPDEKALPGVEFPTGSLGHGLPVAGGIALAAKLDKKDYRVFAVLGDGECAEGSIWEAAISCAHYKLDNLVAILDRNGLQVNGRTADIMDTAPFEDKFLSFGWQVATIDGHDLSQIHQTLAKTPFHQGSPSMIIADTTKCKGLPFGEDDFNYHHWHCELDAIDSSIKTLEDACRKEIEHIG